jgi:hypothetical protein
MLEAMRFSPEKKALFCALVLTGAGWLSGCIRVKPTPPPHLASREQLSVPPSHLVFPVAFDFTTIEKLVNEKLKGTFLHQTIALDAKGDSLRLEISRTEHIRLWWRDKKVRGQFPLRIAGWATVKKAGITIRNAKPVSTDVIIHIESFTRIGPDWNLDFNTKITQIEWRSDPRLQVGPVWINLRKPIEKVVDSKKQELAAKLDGELKKVVPLPQIIGDLWQKMQQPILINRKKIPVYLVYQPEDITAKILSTTKTNVLEVRVATRGMLSTSFSAVPDFVAIALPAKKDTESTSDSLHLHLRARIPFAKINEVMGPEVVKKPLRYEGYEAIIKKAEVYATQNNRLAVAVDVRGDVHGSVYLTGNVAYDTAREQIRVTDFGFDVHSEEMLVQSANWLLHDYVIDMFKDKLQVDVGPVWRQLPALISAGIEKGKSGQKINLLIDSLAVRPGQFLVNQDEIQMVFEATGKARLELEDRIFAKKVKKPSK